ncbi:hypothetical protein D6827_00515, partial [Candidatus Parcubacteria bacterium]
MLTTLLDSEAHRLLKVEDVSDQILFSEDFLSQLLAGELSFTTQDGFSIVDLYSKISMGLFLKNIQDAFISSDSIFSVKEDLISKIDELISSQDFLDRVRMGLVLYPTDSVALQEFSKEARGHAVKVLDGITLQ